MSTKRTLLLRFAMIMGVLLVSGLIFATLAEDIVNHETFFALDPMVGTWILARTTLQGDQLFSLITLLGNAIFISSSTALLGLWLARGRHWGKLIFLFASVGGAAVFNLILKYLIGRPRPDFPLAYLHDTGFSFPSGHAMISIAFYGAVAYLALMTLTGWRSKIFVVLGFLFVSTLIGFSRLYLGVHYLTDVLAGWSAGASWIAACVLANQFVPFRNNQLINPS
jgi:undecaprenyl-diphosphatase